MTTDPKADLHRYFQTARDALLSRLEGLSEYDIRSLVRTGTNLLGLVKHVASVEAGYLGETFGRPFPEPLPWLAQGAEPNADMWATADETGRQIIGLYRTYANITRLQAPGTVAWWPPERHDVTLHQILVHLIAETSRHAGHADIVRGLIDGGAGPGSDSMPASDAQARDEYRAQLERSTRQAAAAADRT